MKKNILLIAFLVLFIKGQSFAAQVPILQDDVAANSVNQIIELEDTQVEPEEKKSNYKMWAIGATVGLAGFGTVAYFLRSLVLSSKSGAQEFGNQQFNSVTFAAAAAHFNAWFSTQNKGPHAQTPYIQKITIPASSQNGNIILIGDLHGCLLPLNRILNKIQKLGYLGEDGRLLQDAYLVFLGDYCTRGKNEEAVLTKVLQLKNINPDHVVALKGNMDAGQPVTNNFPSALYFDLKKSRIVIQCCHGGFQKDVMFDRPRNFLNAPGEYMHVPQDDGYLNMRFSHNEKDLENFGAHKPNFYGPESFCLFRGHDHATFGCKVYDDIALGDSNLLWDKYGALMDYKTTTLVEKGVTSEDGYTRRRIGQCSLHRYPVYTFSAAAGASGATDDKCDIDLEKECFGVFHPGSSKDDNFLEIFEKD